MFGSQVLELGIALSLLFLSVSLICTAAQEALEALLKMRAKDLERGISEMLASTTGGQPGQPSDTRKSAGAVEAFYEHPLIFSLFEGRYRKGGRNLPAYIPSRNFVQAFLDLVMSPPKADGGLAIDPASAITMASLREAAGKIESPALRNAVLSAVNNAADDLDAVRTNLAAWFDGTMDRVSGRYKSRTQGILFVIGLGTALSLNIDPISVARTLSNDNALREAVVAQADAVARADGAAGDLSTDESKRSYAELEARLKGIGFPMGWEDGWPTPQRESLECGERQACLGSWYIPSALLLGLGWLITALAVMLGAPFWFDILNKFMVIRSTVKPREKSQEEGSEDRPTSSRPAH